MEKYPRTNVKDNSTHACVLFVTKLFWSPVNQECRSYSLTTSICRGFLWLHVEDFLETLVSLLLSLKQSPSLSLSLHLNTAFNNHYSHYIFVEY